MDIQGTGDDNDLGTSIKDARGEIRATAIATATVPERPAAPLTPPGKEGGGEAKGHGTKTVSPLPLNV